MINETLNEADQKMDKAVGVAREDFAAIRTGRAHPSMFHKITADYYGTPTPLQQLASFTVPEARVVIIAPYDMGAMSAIEKAIRDSDLGVNPSNDGKVIRVIFPELTEERRRDFVKVARERAEEGRVSIRNLRRHAKHELEKMKKDGTLSEDEERHAEAELQKLTDRCISAVDANLEHKETELSEV